MRSGANPGPRRRAEVRAARVIQIHVPHQLLDRLRTRATRSQVRAERVAKAVHAAVGKVRQILGPLDQSPDAALGEGFDDVHHVGDTSVPERHHSGSCAIGT